MLRERKVLAEEELPEARFFDHEGIPFVQADAYFYRYLGAGQVREVVEGENEAHIRSASTRITRERAEELAEMFNRTVVRLERRKRGEGKRKKRYWERLSETQRLSNGNNRSSDPHRRAAGGIG